MRSRTTQALAGLLLVALAVGAVAAVSSPTMPYTETLNVTNNTAEIEVVAENISSGTTTTAAGVLNVTVYGNASGATTQVATGQLDTSNSSVFTDTYTYTGVNATEYGFYDVEVTGDGVDNLTISKVSTSAAGGFFGGSGGGIAGVVLVAGALWVLAGRN